MLNTILVALDSSELSEQVIQTLKQLQLGADANVILSHVVPTATANPDLEVDRSTTSTELLTYRNLEKQLQAYQDKLPCQSQLELVSGDPAEEIIRLANIYQADLIVIGNRGLTGLNRILQGSVSSQVVSDAPCSVLVVKPKAEKQPVE
ncbi:MAG: universal stress protein [Cyanothece sp. SIO1E1]|nr:universal stress protein [Cyanothece sp. SIO1E1]